MSGMGATAAVRAGPLVLKRSLLCSYKTSAAGLIHLCEDAVIPKVTQNLFSPSVNGVHKNSALCRAVTKGGLCDLIRTAGCTFKWFQAGAPLGTCYKPFFPSALYPDFPAGPFALPLLTIGALTLTDVFCPTRSFSPSYRSRTVSESDTSSLTVTAASTSRTVLRNGGLRRHPSQVSLLRLHQVRAEVGGRSLYPVDKVD